MRCHPCTLGAPNLGMNYNQGPDVKGMKERQKQVGLQTHDFSGGNTKKGSWRKLQ